MGMVGLTVPSQHCLAKANCGLREGAVPSAYSCSIAVFALSTDTAVHFVAKSNTP